jgi:hypothetical protein
VDYMIDVIRTFCMTSNVSEAAAVSKSVL